MTSQVAHKWSVGVVECWSDGFKAQYSITPTLQYSSLLVPVQPLHETFLFDFIDQAHIDEFGGIFLIGVDGSQNILDPFQFHTRGSRQALREKFVRSLHRLGVRNLQMFSQNL
jgi:hypothetical protein